METGETWYSYWLLPVAASGRAATTTGVQLTFVRRIEICPRHTKSAKIVYL